MSSSPLPQWHSLTIPYHSRISCRRNGFVHSFCSIPGIGLFFSSFFLVGFIFYMTFLSAHGPLFLGPSGWYTPTNHVASSLTSDVFSLEQIRDIIAPTRGFYARDYSLNLGWNNVRTHGNQIRAELIIPK